MVKHNIKITDSRVIKAIDMYREGKGAKVICKELKMDGATLNRFLNELGLKKTQAERVRAGKTDSTINHEALNVLTPEVLYWIGFLYADGHIEKDRPRITLTLSEIDKGHLEKFSKFLGEGLTVRQVESRQLKNNGYYSNPAFRVCVSSKEIYNRLKELGFTHRKTYSTEDLNTLLINSRDFWRGIVDGDGWVINKTQVGVGLSGSKVTIEYFLAFLNVSGVNTQTTPYQSKRTEHMWTCDIHHNKAKAALTLLYKDANTYLERKYQKYLEILKE